MERKRGRIGLACLHIFIGLGAMAGGLASILEPAKPMGMDAVEALQIGPFKDFLIPGLFLFFVIGVGNVGVGWLVAKHSRWAAYATGCCGGVLILWIVIQCIVLQVVIGLHVLYFFIGVWLGIVALVQLWQQDLFPLNALKSRWKH